MRRTAPFSRWPRTLRARDSAPRSRAISPSRGTSGVDDVHVAEASHGRTVADGVHLNGLTLGIAERAAEEVALRAADHVEAAPEFRRADLIGDILEHADDLSALDLIEDL